MSGVSKLDGIWNALVRTHHITSRKKVARLRQAASHNAVYVLLRSGGTPGIMYVEGSKSGVEEWVHAVQRLKYKDYQLAARPAVVDREGGKHEAAGAQNSGLYETDSVKDFAEQMRRRCVFAWWRTAMGYASHDDRL